MGDEKRPTPDAGGEAQGTDGPSGGFELEELREGIRKRLDVPPPPPPPPAAPPPGPPPPSEDEVDARTVAERLGRDVERRAGRRPPPAGWPGEAFSFPFRGSPVGLGLAVGGWVLLDLASWSNLFVGTVLKALAYVFFLRWQLGVANATSAGRDEPSPFARVADVDMADLRGLARLLGLGAALVLPGIVLLLLERTAAGVLLLLVGLLWAAVAALGQVVGEPSLVLPWKALAWMGARPLGLWASTVGWVAAVGVEALVWAQHGTGAFAALALSIPARAAFVYLWLLSARALGVVGRAWSPYEDDDEA